MTIWCGKCHGTFEDGREFRKHGCVKLLPKPTPAPAPRPKVAA